MSSYRFCRSDDLTLLAQGYNDCYRPHFADLPPLTVGDLKQLIRRLDLWTSSCMIAADGDKLVAVLLAAKREQANLIYCVGVHPDHQRCEHGRHLLGSLAQKLEILGPRRMVAEVPAEWSQAREFLEACGYVREREYTDFRLHVRPEPPAAVDFVAAVTVDDLLAGRCFDHDALRCWERAPKTILNLRDRVKGLAIASDERVEAYLLYHEPTPHGEREILALDSAREDRREPLLSLLLSSCCYAADAPVLIKRAVPEEVPFGLLEAIGFRAAGRTIGYSRTA